VNEEDELRLKELRLRILAPFQAQRGTNVWAPWGPSGWSAVVILKPKCKWATGLRVKPNNGKEVSEGKVPLGRLLRRDPKLKGKDRPTFSPDVVFAHRKAEEEKKMEPEPAGVVTPPPPPVETPEQKIKRTASERLRRAQRIVELFGSDTTPDDW